MANIRVDLDHPICDGESVTFKAPCDCTAVTGVIVYYPTSNATASKTFVFKDAHGNTLTGVGNLFMTGAYVKVVLDTTNGYAYVQNADTNKYLETKIAEAKTVAESAAPVVSTTAPTNTSTVWVDTANGGVMKYHNGTTWVTIAAVYAE